MGYKVVSILEGDAAGNLMKSHLDFYAQLNIGDVGDVYQEHGIDVVYTMCMDLVRLAKGV
jgi:hypothetical protein